MSVINVGIAGYGASAKYMHAPFLKVSPHYNVSAVLERHNNESHGLFPEAVIVRSFEELISRDDVELVIITTPNETHLDFAKQAMEKGKDVVLEKPFTITSADALELINISKETNRVLSVFQNRRYVSDFMTMQEILHKKLLGNIHDFESHYDRYRPALKENAWREELKPGSGILYDLGPHIIDQALCLFGLPKFITAIVRIQRPAAVIDDYFDITMDYGDKIIILKSGMMVRKPGPRYLIHGDKGSFVKYGEDPQEALLRAGHLPLAPDWGVENENIYGLLHTEIDGEIIKTNYPSQTGNYGIYYQHLFNTIIHGEELREKPEHGYNTIKIIEMGLESSARKVTVECSDLLDVKY